LLSALRAIFTDCAQAILGVPLTARIAVAGLPIDTGAVGGPFTITYNVSDGAGNPAVEVTRTVNVVDTTPPVISLLGSANVSIEVGSVYADAGATASSMRHIGLPSCPFAVCGFAFSSLARSCPPGQAPAILFGL